MPGNQAERTIDDDYRTIKNCIEIYDDGDGARVGEVLDTLGGTEDWSRDEVAASLAVLAKTGEVYGRGLEADGGHDDNGWVKVTP